MPEAEYLACKDHAKSSNKATQVELLMTKNEVFSQTAVVQTIVDKVNNKTGNIAFRVTFPNPDAPLRNRQRAHDRAAERCPGYSVKATFEILEKKCIFVIDKTNVVHQREIGIASEIPGLYVVRSDITGTDRILLESLSKVQDDDKISYDYKAPRSVLSHLRVYIEYELRVNACQTVMPGAAEASRVQH